MTAMWTQTAAIHLATQIEKVCPDFGCHVALTGGLLYKYNPPKSRKDCDLVFYRIRQVEKIDVDGLFTALAAIGIERVTKKESFVIKAKHALGDIDFLFPEFEGEYSSETETKPDREDGPRCDCGLLVPECTAAGPANHASRLAPDINF